MAADARITALRRKKTHTEIDRKKEKEGERRKEYQVRRGHLRRASFSTLIAFQGRKQLAVKRDDKVIAVRLLLSLQLNLPRLIAPLM